MATTHWMEFIGDLLGQLHSNLGIALTGMGHDPMPGSVADREMSQLPDDESLETAYSQGTILIDATMDHFTGFVRSIRMPVLTIAPWTNVRGLVEAAAIGQWLLDPDLDAKERIKRSLQFRCEGLSQQMKFGRIIGQEEEIQAGQNHYEKVLEKASSFGLQVNRDENDRPKSLAQKMPSTTTLVSQSLEAEPAYRLLSAIAHAHPWALQQASFSKVDHPSRNLLEKNLAPESVTYLGDLALQASRKPIVSKCQLFGWPSEGIAEFFDLARQQFMAVMKDVLKS